FLIAGPFSSFIRARFLLTRFLPWRIRRGILCLRWRTPWPCVLGVNCLIQPVPVEIHAERFHIAIIVPSVPAITAAPRNDPGRTGARVPVGRQGKGACFPETSRRGTKKKCDLVGRIR